MATEKPSWFQRLSNSLSKSRNSFSYQLRAVFSGNEVTEQSWQELEETLIAADVGVDSTIAIVEELRSDVVARGIFEPAGVLDLLKEKLAARLAVVDSGLRLEDLQPPAILLVVGVNGTGKTTTIGKLANYLKNQGRSVVLVAADTFRAAAVEQLDEWARRVGVDIVKHQRGADPAAVVYDAIQSLRAKGIDFLIADTAGRLHTYVNLMEELKKIKRVAVREAQGVPVKTLLVMDATTGQNGIAQARLFHEALELDGLVLTKLDGTAKGGIVVAVQDQLSLPVTMIGIGEQLDDVQPFRPDAFAEALLS